MILQFILLFWSFFQIGLFGFGGGYAMVSMIQGEVVTHYHWMTMGQFTDILAISQMTPGPIGINTATYVGYTSIVNAGHAWYWGVLGSFIATLSIVLPSFILMLLITRFLIAHKNHPIVVNIFSWLRPAVVGLIMAATLCLMNEENFSSPSICPWQFWISVGLFLFAFISVTVYKMNPIRIICLCGLAGLILL
ncbi:MAG: chromate transporter [Bacteroidaceae bacterium]|nr:chromate transporter [Bacteroidaceae bacterium]